MRSDCYLHTRQSRWSCQLRYNCEYQTFYPSRSKPIIDEINRPLRDDNEINPDVLDFIINYDIKYRMGRDGGAGE
jgi:hypothetical protein